MLWSLLSLKFFVYAVVSFVNLSTICMLVYIVMYCMCFMFIVLPPIVTQHPEDQLIELRSNLSNTTLSCKASGYQVMYTWTFNELIINADSHHIIDGPILQIFHLKPSDRGRYLCIAKNIGGFTNSELANIILSGELMHVYNIVQERVYPILRSEGLLHAVQQFVYRCVDRGNEIHNLECYLRSLFCLTT